MPSELLTDMSELLDLLKAKGVARANVVMPGTLGTIDVTFATAAAALPDEKDSAPADMCRCGHHIAEHQNGECMHACDAERCST